MNRLSVERRAQVVACLVEGMSIRSTTRITGAAKNTVVKLVEELGQASADYLDAHLVGLPCRRVQVDELWSFCVMKAKTARAQGRDGEPGVGSVWTWTALDPDSKLLLSFLVGDRSGECAEMFIADVAKRLAGRVQLTSDGYSGYLGAVERGFGADVDYAQVVKHYETRANGSDGRYVSSEKLVVMGAPDDAHTSTSLVERHNLTVRMGMRRFTRRTNGHSKKIENHFAAFALFALHYNYCRKHETLTKRHRYPQTPAMATGLADHVWTLAELVTTLASN
jgi:IS1 family transposase